MYRLKAVSLAARQLRSVASPASAFKTRWLHKSAPALAHPSESFLSGTLGNYADEMYKSWQADPKSVHKSWDVYFSNLTKGLPPGAAFRPPPTLVTESFVGAPVNFNAASPDDVRLHLAVQSLVRSFQVRGHNNAKLDPLGINHADLQAEPPMELDLKTYSFTEADLDREFHLGTASHKGFLDPERKPYKLRELLSYLQEVYCGTIGVEYMYIPSREQCNWIRERVETDQKYKFSPEERKLIFKRLVEADGFEGFLANKWSAEKRFGLEGCESLIPGMKAIIDTAGALGMENIVFGMPHRGRLNVLNNVLGKPLENIFCEFASELDPDQEGSGDVKYHLGMSNDIVLKDGKKVHLSLVANPSHLEAVDPVVQGKVRAEQFFKKDDARKKVMSVLLHGDAAFSGQGVVFETFGLSNLPNYTTGGTIHIVVNNQIGFTTDPRFSRSSPHCSDVAKTVDAPVFHVNGDDVEAVVHVCKLAAEWRQTFNKDVVIDIVCYRRHGHNEIDQPAFTQPLMYQKIAAHPPVVNVYAEKLLAEGVLTPAEVDAEKSSFQEKCNHAYEKSKSHKPKMTDWLESKWEGFKSKRQLARIKNTGVPLDTLKYVGNIISSCSPDITLHPGIARIMKARKQTVESGTGLDWATGEALAFGTLLLEGNHVRLSGQDVERGTFSHRHHVLHDQKTEATYTPLHHLSEKQAVYTVSNSSLSEFGVLGFELGYSMTNPNSLVLWEAQFGDFCNGAQVIIDQFISSGEAKWLRQSGLVMLLPHGYEGMGPEHSSARLERFLQMSEDDPDIFPEMAHATRTQIQHNNWQVVNCSTPANYYHVLRRQVHREFRKPLIVMSPKSLLRHRDATSSMEDMAEGTRFRRVIFDTQVKTGADVKKNVFCSGKVYYDLLKARQETGRTDIAITRVEQICPFPFDLVKESAELYPNAEIVWCQEEPKNMGSWTYVEPRFFTALAASKTHAGVRAKYVGRKPSAATACGNKKMHIKEEEELLRNAMS
eukprot:Colp12_sorted_trinity150504_noHs@20928